MHRFVGDTANKRGHEFGAKVSRAISELGYKTHSEIEMTKLGASKKDGLGDIDVFAWDSKTGIVIAIECKCLMPAITIREVVQRLEEFRGKREEKDSLGRHLRRTDWLTKHLDAVSKHTQIPSDRIRLTSLLVTSETVPMQFFSDMNFPTSQVIPFDKLEKHLKGLLN
jgi:hypothetical protein